MNYDNYLKVFLDVNILIIYGNYSGSQFQGSEFKVRERLARLVPQSGTRQVKIERLKMGKVHAVMSGDGLHVVHNLPFILLNQRIV